MWELPEHFPIGVDAEGLGPVSPDEEEFDRYLCWCGDDECVLWRDA